MSTANETSKTYSNNEKVQFIVPSLSKEIYDGIVVGIANTGIPILGQGILIQHNNEKLYNLYSESYPFYTLVIFENNILGTSQYSQFFNLYLEHFSEKSV